MDTHRSVTAEKKWMVLGELEFFFVCSFTTKMKAFTYLISYIFCGQILETGILEDTSTR